MLKIRNDPFILRPGPFARPVSIDGKTHCSKGPTTWIRVAQKRQKSPQNGTASYDRTAQIWEVRTGNRVAPPIRSDQGVMGAAFSGDGRRVLINTPNSARIFDARTSAPLTPPMRHANRVNLARFSSDGHWVATASEDGTARIWDTRSGFPATEAEALSNGHQFGLAAGQPASIDRLTRWQNPPLETPGD